jgi:hypothetical protein
MNQSITNSVWSFWTKPFNAHRRSIWASEKHHLLCWILSLETARKHYPNTVLFTDNDGAQILIDGVGLEFDSVSTELNELQAYDPDWWILGKLWAYRSQMEPFVHIDNDVFLWKPLPNIVAQAPILAQNPEYFVFGEHYATSWWYRPEIFDVRVKGMHGWLPEEWNWYITNRRELAYCCGIFGGNHTAFISHYADLALQIATHPHNQAAFSLMENKPGDCLLIEQYFLAACLEYHKQYTDSKFQELRMECLFESPEVAFSSNQPEKIGYTHLIGFAKQNQQIAERVEKRVAQEYPVQYERCLRYLNTIQFLLGATPSSLSPSRATNSQESSIHANYLSVPSLAAIDSATVDPQVWVTLFTQLRSALCDHVAKRSLFVNETSSESDRTLIHFSLQDIFQVCTTGIVQVRINNSNNTNVIQLLLTLAEAQETFLSTLDQYGNPSDAGKTSFINDYRRRLDVLKNEVVNSNLINAYFAQQDIANWLSVGSEAASFLSTNWNSLMENAFGRFLQQNPSFINPERPLYTSQTLSQFLREFNSFFQAPIISSCQQNSTQPLERVLPGISSSLGFPLEIYVGTLREMKNGVAASSGLSNDAKAIALTFFDYTIGFFS